MDFTQKSHWVKGGRLTKDPARSNFAGVLSKESVHIIFIYVVLNDLNICAADIKSTYVQAPTSKKYFMKFGNECLME